MSGVPIYLQIIDQVNALVLSGRLKPGDTLTSASVKERQAELRTLIEQAVLRGLQLKLSDLQIIASCNPS